mgnify:CR=1 FL=1
MTMGIFSVSAQNDEDEDGFPKDITIRPTPFSLRLDLSVPTPTNAAWRKCMVGIAEGDLTFDYRIAGSNFITGIGYKGSFLYTPPKFFLFDVKTKMQMHNAYLTLGYDLYKSNTYFIKCYYNNHC